MHGLSGVKVKLRALLIVALLGGTPLAVATDATAQIKPATSGAQGFDEPEMRRHHSGLKHPNEPHHSRRLPPAPPRPKP